MLHNTGSKLTDSLLYAFSTELLWIAIIEEHLTDHNSNFC